MSESHYLDRLDSSVNQIQFLWQLNEYRMSALMGDVDHPMDRWILDQIDGHRDIVDVAAEAGVTTLEADVAISREIKRQVQR